MTAGLQVSRLIDVNVNLEPAAAQSPSVTTCMIVGSSNVINTNDRYRSYSSLTDVATDFGTSAPEYLAAALFFGQDPSPEQLYIGRWAQAATSGILECGALTTAQQVITNWSGINNGSFHITVDGGGPISITALDFTAQVNLNGVATVINTALAAHGSTCAWSAEFGQFTFTSNTTGAASSIAPLTAGAGGTDISAQLGGTLATGAVEVNGIVAETALAAVQILDTLPVNFYMLMFASTHIVDADHEAIAAYIEGDANPHYYGVTTNEAAALSPSATSDIGYILSQLKYNRTECFWSSTQPYASASYFGRMATINYEAQNSTIALMYKQMPGVAPELLLSSQANALDGKYYNYYATYNNGVPIIVNGWSVSGFFTDEIQGSDWLVAQVQTDLFNALLQAPKIPQTDAGVNTLVATVKGSLSIGLANGQIGPGVWEFTGFGTLTKGTYLETGFYVWAPSVASQLPADRLARKSPLIQAAVIFAGAVQSVAVLINVQR